MFKLAHFQMIHCTVHTMYMVQGKKYIQNISTCNRKLHNIILNIRGIHMEKNKLKLLLWK